MITNRKILRDVGIELQRLEKKIHEALLQTDKDLEGDKPKYFASCKRDAQDLKQELTKLTQSSKYKWGQL